MSKISLIHKQSYKHLKEAHFPTPQSNGGKKWVYAIVRWMMREEERMKEEKVSFT